MPPDINSLPPSRSPSTRTAMPPTSPIPSPSSPSVATTSLQAAAAVNAGLQREDSRRMSGSSNTSLNGRPRGQGRRRSTVLMNLQLNDPSLPSPGEMINSPHSLSGSPIIGTGDPHHNRAPSLGEIHQELEQEQEAQVNRLLHMIRTQQQQLQQLQLASGQAASQPSAIDDSTPTSERSMSLQASTLPPSTSLPAQSPPIRTNPRASFDMSRADPLYYRSRTPSRTASPRMRSTSISIEGGAAGEGWTLPPRDESAFYQAETQMLTRENQMLRMRIRELERQLGEYNANSAITREPAVPSNLVSRRSRSISEENEEHASADVTPVGGDSAKDE